MNKLLILAVSAAFHTVCLGMYQQADKSTPAHLARNKPAAINDALPGAPASKKMKHGPDVQIKAEDATPPRVVSVSDKEQNPQEVLNNLLACATEQELERKLASFVHPIATTLPLVKSILLEGFKRRLEQKQELAQAQETCDALEQQAAGEMLAKEKMKAALLEVQREIAEQQKCIDTDLKKFIYKELGHE